MGSPVASVLIVDDNPATARTLRLVLSTEGYEADWAATADEALRMAGNGPYEAALIDISLPDQSGIDLLPKLKRLLPSLVAVIVTGHASTNSSIEALNRGASGYVRKPVEVQQLLALLRTGLEKERLEEQNRLMLRRLSLLHAVGATVGAGLEPGETLLETLSLVVSLLDLSAGAIWWGGVTNQELRPAASVGLPETLMDQLTGEVRRCAGEEHAPRRAPPQGSWTGVHLHLEADNTDWQFRLLPLRGNRERIAWLAVGGPKDDANEAQDPGFVGAVASQLGVAMENMQLYENLRIAYDQLRDAQAQVVRSEKLSALSRVISGVAHELNNPLAAILGYCEVLAKDGVCQQAIPMVRRVARQANRCAGIVKELAAFAQPEEMSIAEVDIHEVLDSALEAADDHRGQDTKVIQRLAESVPRTTGDAQALQQALTNVIVNGYQAMQDGDGALTLETTTENGEIVVLISDTGPGIPADTLPRVFDPFFTTKAVDQGSGLGLSVSHGIVREHGGELLADSGPYGGAVFTVRLPIREPSRTTDQNRSTAPDFMTECAPRLK